MADNKTFDVTDNSFESEVLQSEQPVLVDFWADWCGPCRMIAPSVKAIAEEYEGKLRVAKMDVDDNPMTPGRYAIVGIPTVMLFKGGEVVERITGAWPKDKIVAKILPHIEN
ncbi:MAG: thioredoxin [Anaerolineales bacterium]|nr:thioredoxin [Anaerolineales bacterium]